MRRRRASLLIASGLLSGTAATAQPIVTSPSPERIEVTVYRDPDRGEREMDLDWLNGFALVSERRRIVLEAV